MDSFGGTPRCCFHEHRWREPAAVDELLNRPKDFGSPDHGILGQSESSQLFHKHLVVVCAEEWDGLSAGLPVLVPGAVSVALGGVLLGLDGRRQREVRTALLLPRGGGRWGW